MNEANGSTEMWPGTHLETSVVMQDGGIKVGEAALDAQRAIEARPGISSWPQNEKTKLDLSGSGLDEDYQGKDRG